MCTCGMDIATQQASPATHKRISKAFGDRPSSAAAANGSAVVAGVGARRRSAETSGSMVTAQNTAIPICVARQPCVAMKCYSSGGQIVPAMYCPHETIATAMPRRRVNHCEVSATSGPNVAEAPKPISP